MTAYVLLKYLHVLLAIVAVGTNFTYGPWLARAAREPKMLAFTLRGVKFLDDRIANPAFILLPITGFAMLPLGPYRWSTPWVLAGLVLYVAFAVVGFAGYTPVLRRQIATLEAGGPDSPEFRALSATAQRLGLVLAVLVLLIVFLMVTKPRLWG